MSYSIVTEGALQRRINRRLANDGKKLERTRSARMEREYGRYILKENGTIRDSHVDIISLGHALEVLGFNEAVAA